LTLPLGRGNLVAKSPPWRFFCDGIAGVISNKLTRERAETLALQGLAFLAGRDEDIERFLRNTGLDMTGLRARAADPDLLRAVLDYILAGDATTTGFCDEQTIDPKLLHEANRLLSQPRDL
jgi:hypothetical protein